MFAQVRWLAVMVDASISHQLFVWVDHKIRPVDIDIDERHAIDEEGEERL